MLNKTNTNKGERVMLNKSKKVLNEVRELAKKNQYTEARNLLHKNSYLCDLDSAFWTVYQGLSMLYLELTKERA